VKTNDLHAIKSIELGITKEKFGKIITFIDYGNVNYWYEKDTQLTDETAIAEDEKIVIDLSKLADFVTSFSLKSYFYYGFNPQKPGSLYFISTARKLFTAAPTKAMQFIKHYLDIRELKSTTHKIKKDHRGYFIVFAKCNFDVEIAIDSLRRSTECDTICIFSDDADFVALIKRLHSLKKKVILISTGRTIRELRESADLHIQAQDLKNAISKVKKISPVRARLGSRTRNREQGSQGLQTDTNTRILKKSSTQHYKSKKNPRKKLN